MKEIQITMSCINCRSSGHVPETGGYICRRYAGNIENSLPCDDWVPSKHNVKVWIGRVKE